MKQRKHRIQKQQHRTIKGLTAAGACVGMIAGAGLSAHAQSTTEADQIAQLQKQNQALQQQLDTLDDMAKKEGLLPSGGDPPVSAMSQMTISGFVQTSYFYNVERPASGYSDGYLWNTKDNNFSLNKIKITLASPALDRSKWDAGYRMSLMFGEDSSALDPNDSGIPSLEDVREGYVDLNVPIGTGLDIKAGKLISLLNYESGDGGAANENFSQGYQWFYTGNGPSDGVQLDYAFTSWLDVKARVDNGLYAGNMSTTSRKGVMGSIGITPDSKTWISLVGFGGEGGGSEQADGGSVLGGRQLTDKLGSGFEFDYFHLYNDGGPQSGDLWSIGGWIWYDFTPKIGLAFRAEFLDDPDGVGINVNTVADPNSLAPAPNGAGISSTDPNGNLDSFTLTLNLKPVPNIKIQPEIRYNTTSYAGGFNGKDYQFIIGCGGTYLF